MAGPRPRRRVLVFVLAAAITGALVLLAQTAASTGPDASAAVQTYLDQVRPGIQRSTEDGADFADIRTSASKLGRDGLDRRLDRLANSVTATLQTVDALSPPPSLRVAHAYLVATLGVRAKAVGEARPALDGALTQSPTPDAGIPEASAALVTVGQDLQLGDRAIGLFTGALPRGVEVPPASAWVGSTGDWDPVEIQAFVAALRSSGSAAPVHDLAMIALQTDPAAVAVAPDGSQVIPASHVIAVSMVVENVGNQVERNVTVNALLTLTNGGQQSLRDFVDLAPGQRRALTLQSLRADAGSSGTLQVVAQPVRGETNIVNNSVSVQVTFR